VATSALGRVRPKPRTVSPVTACSGDSSIKPTLSAGPTNWRAESQGTLDAVTLCFQGLAVDLGELHALRERERPRRNHVVTERCRYERPLVVGRARTDRHQRDADEERSTPSW
jgi:hypothetical protein